MSISFFMACLDGDLTGRNCYMTQYYVVLFDEYTSMVPETWVCKETKTVLWPPFPVDKLKMRYMQPDDSYTKYTYTRILGPYDYKEANEVEHKSLNISTNDETDVAVRKTDGSQQSKKRIVKRNSRYVSDDESDDSSNQNNELSDTCNVKLPNPPKNAISEKLNKRINKEPNLNGKTEMKNCKVRLTSNVDLQRPYHAESAKGKMTPGLLTKNRVHNAQCDAEDNEMGSVHSHALDAFERPTPPLYTNKNKSMLNKGSENSDRKYVSIEQFNKLKKKLLMARKERKSEDAQCESETEDEDEFPMLPLDNEDDLESFDRLIKQDRRIKKKLAKMIRKIDGPNITAFTHRCMERLMTTKLAVKYSWSGQTRGKNKEHKTLKFKNKKLADVIINSIVSTRSKYTENDCRKVIMKWLNTAKQRMEYQEKKERQEREENEEVDDDGNDDEKVDVEESEDDEYCE